jgi:hypothetical protein
MALAQVFSGYFGFSCHPFIHFTNRSTINTIYHPGLENKPINGRCNSGTGSTPAPEIIKGKVPQMVHADSECL